MTDIFQRIRQAKLWLVLMLLAFVVQSLALHEFLRFDRSLVEQGQWWRLLSAHLTHIGWSHYWLNMAGIIMIAVFFAPYQPDRYWLLAMIAIAVICSLGLLLDGVLDRYVGLSGVLHGLFIIGGRWEWKRYRLSGAVMLMLITGKLLWEQLYGALPGSESMAGGTVAINAHLYGAAGGLVYILLSEKLLRGRWGLVRY